MDSSAMINVAEVLYGLICVVGFVVNFMTIYVVLCRLSVDNKKTLIANCIFHLAICDLIAIIYLPFSITSINGGWTFGASLCNITMLLMITVQFTKSFLLSVIGLTSFGEYRGQIHQLTDNKIRILTGLCWLIGLILGSIFVSYASLSIKCDIFWPEHSYFNYNESFTFIYSICYFFSPALLFGILYFQKIRRQPWESNQKTIDNLNLTIAILIIHLSASFFHILAQWIYIFDKVPIGLPEPMWKINIALISGMIWYLSTIGSPVVYYLFWSDFRDAVVDIFYQTTEYRPMTRFENNKV